MVRAKELLAYAAVCFAALLIAASLGTATHAQTLFGSSAGHEKAAHGRAYLFRGLIGMIDWGMDQLAARIDRFGVAADIEGYSAWRSVAAQAISDYHRDPRPITVIGHSIGGDSAVEFAEALGAAHVPVSLLITYDPTRAAHAVPANVERYINLYQSSNILGGGDLEPGRGFHGHYASYNLKNRPEIVHINLDKFDAIQAQLAAKVRSAALRGEGETIPLRLVPPATGAIELWDSGEPISAHAGDTLQTVAAAYHVPLWALIELNPKAEHGPLAEGEHIVVPRYIGAKR
jgi:thioesterase domain-containing protein